MERPRTGEALYLEERRNNESAIGWIRESAKHPGFFSIAILPGGGLETTSRRPVRWSVTLPDGSEQNMVEMELPRLGFFSPMITRWASSGVIDLVEELHAGTMSQPPEEPPQPVRRTTKPAVPKTARPKRKAT
jgi:hypothetical protein